MFVNRKLTKSGNHSFMSLSYDVLWYEDNRSLLVFLFHMHFILKTQMIWTETMTNIAYSLPLFKSCWKFSSHWIVVTRKKVNNELRWFQLLLLWHQKLSMIASHLSNSSVFIYFQLERCRGMVVTENRKILDHSFHWIQ